jgi:carboxymethylenebutenolidase
MGDMITLTAEDGVSIGAYVAKPTGKPRGGIVVIQEIFGVNHHIRAVADRYAAEGYLAVAPALYDRVEPNYESGYEQPDMQAGVAIRGKTDMAKVVLDVKAAVAKAAEAGKVGVVGYCWGGTLAFAAAGKIPGVAAAVGYYGAGIAAMADQKPVAPTILHFGEKDHSIPATDVEKIKAARPDVPVYVYAAGHGFNCDERGAYDAPAADVARERTYAHFKQFVG